MTLFGRAISSSQPQTNTHIDVNTYGSRYVAERIVHHLNDILSAPFMLTGGGLFPQNVRQTADADIKSVRRISNREMQNAMKVIAPSFKEPVKNPGRQARLYRPVLEGLSAGQAEERGPRPEKGQEAGAQLFSWAEGYRPPPLYPIERISVVRADLEEDEAVAFPFPFPLSDSYAVEDLIAELGAAFLCGDLGLSPEPHADHACYIKSWLTVLKNDKKVTPTAASKA